LERCRRSPLAFDYILFADADMELVVGDPSFRDRLSAPAYLVQQRAGISYDNLRLLRRDVPAHHVGATHEYLDLQGSSRERLADIWYIDHASGANRAGKSERDARMLEEDLVRDPGNARSVFYLAQSYRDAGELVRARDAYRRRVAMGGFDEEVWYSLHEIARLNERLAAPVAEIRSAYLDAFQFRPTRAEPLYQLARFHRERSEWGLAHLFAQRAVAIPRPADDILFVDDSVYLWRCLDELGVAGYWAGQRAEGRAATERVLAEGHLPSRSGRASCRTWASIWTVRTRRPARGARRSAATAQRSFASVPAPHPVCARRQLPRRLGLPARRAGRGTHGGAPGLDHARARRARGARPRALRGRVRDFEPDVVLLQRAFEPHQHPDRLRPAIVVVDLDDALFQRGDLAPRMESAVASAHAFVGGNRFVADWGRRFNANVHVIPTCAPGAG
jgi:hypothetical protein